MSRQVECEVYAVDIENTNSLGTHPGVEVECSRCGHCEQSSGDSGRSIRRCLALLRENCPENEENYYTAEGSDED